METPQVLPRNMEQFSMSELYDLLAEETIRFNRMLLQKAPKDELSGLKNLIKQLQEEIKRRKDQ